MDTIGTLSYSTFLVGVSLATRLPELSFTAEADKRMLAYTANMATTRSGYKACVVSHSDMEVPFIENVH